MREGRWIGETWWREEREGGQRSPRACSVSLLHSFERCPPPCDTAASPIAAPAHPPPHTTKHVPCEIFVKQSPMNKIK